MRGKFCCFALIIVLCASFALCACSPQIDLDEQYGFTDEERSYPFWKGNVMRNEAVMVVEKNGAVQGRLLYPALKVIAVYDYSLTRLFVENVDYVVNGDVITLPRGSAIPVFKDEWSLGQNVPEEYPEGNVSTGYNILSGVLHSESDLICGNYINVSYVYDSGKINKNSFPSYRNKLTGLNGMMSSKNNVKFAVYGDSISVGYSSSRAMNRAPYQPSYGEMVANEIERRADGTVARKNFSVGGTSAYWATQEPQLQQIVEYAPDICIIAFGTNDGLESFQNGTFRNSITAVIDALRQANADCQIILVAPFPCNPAYKDAKSQKLNVSQLQSIADGKKYRDVVCVDIYTPCVNMLKKKNYYELSASNINHPNDFIHRFYAMCILSAMFDYDAE